VADWLMSHHGKWPSRLLRKWQQYEAMGLEITFHHPDDRSATTLEIELPSWPWRWVCWLQGHHPYDPRSRKDNYCIICRKHLGDPHA
jgi:hypothetical protein